MDKIVIQTSSSERAYNLMSCLRTLFPMFEIEMQLMKMGRHGDVTGKSEQNSNRENINSAIDNSNF